MDNKEKLRLYKEQLYEIEKDLQNIIKRIENRISFIEYFGKKVRISKKDKEELSKLKI